MKMRRGAGGQAAGGLRQRLRERRALKVEQARAGAAFKREWERSGEVGKLGASEGWSTGGWPGG